MFCLYIRREISQFLSNYRPVSLLSGVGKLLERIVFKNIYNFLHENNLIYRLQSGVVGWCDGAG